jgi:hypothetical protein
MGDDKDIFQAMAFIISGMRAKGVITFNRIPNVCCNLNHKQERRRKWLKLDWR